MEEPSPNSFPPVREEESGQKLLKFLERRLGLPANLLHRWIRTGQIRLNGGRCKPFVIVNAGDAVRVPPFALSMVKEAAEDFALPVDLPPLAGQYEGLLAFNKPAGLPVQPGTGHQDCMCARLNASFAASPFKPAPCHRLDKDTSGILLVGSTFPALKKAQEMFREGRAHKEYLAFAEGRWPEKKDFLLIHYLRKEGQPGSVKTRCSAAPLPYAKKAITIVRPLRVENNASLLQLRLITGRTHQLRAQLAAAGFPIAGDGKYGRGGGEMRLHAMRVILPDWCEFSILPDWDCGLAADNLPDPICRGWDLSQILTLPKMNDSLT